MSTLTMPKSSEIDPTKVCRTCLTESSRMRSLFLPKEGGQQKPSEVLFFVTNMIVKEEDELPKQICSDCEILMQQFNMFKRRCKESEAKLLGLITEGSEVAKPLVKSENSCELRSMKLEQPFQCSICSVMFSDIHELGIHVRNIHCKIVNESSTNVSQFSNLSDSLTSSKLTDVDLNVVKGDQQHIKEELLESNNVLEDDFITADHYEPNLTEDIQNYDLIQVKNLNECASYTCSSCNIKLDSKLKFEEHMRDTHLTLSAIKEECQNNRKRLQKVTDSSEKVNSAFKAYNCEYCNLKLKTKKSYKNHVRRKHSYIQGTASIKTIIVEDKEFEKKHQCSHCMRKFVKKSTLAAHLKRHESTTSSHMCVVCKREFKHRAHLDNHILSVHSSQNGLRCDYCPKSFTTQESLDLHKTMHLNEKKHQCKFCSKAFNMLSTLRDHLRVHTGEKPFLCPQCGKGFTQNTNLIEHLRRHQGIKPFKCDLCDRRFVSKGELAAHARKHTGAHPFVCDDCGGGFTTSSSLVKHRRTHTGERPYGCDLCHMKFAASGTLKNHRRTHTGEKPYKCTHCDKAFVQKNDLVAHTRCHTGERPYVCSTCGQAFRQGSALKAHLKMHQGKPSLMRTTAV